MAALANNYVSLNSATLLSHKSLSNKKSLWSSDAVEYILMGTGILHMIQPFWGYRLTIKASVSAGIFTI